MIDSASGIKASTSFVKSFSCFLLSAIENVQAGEFSSS